MENRTLLGVDDSLVMNTKGVGAWTADKYSLVRLYAQLFTSGMKGKWKSLVYVDLYSGSGQSRIESTGEILLGSPLIALSIDHQFDRYVFVEKDPIALNALKQRVAARYPNAKIDFIGDDCNSAIEKIQNAIPPDALVLCFVDPYDLGIRFETLQILAETRKVDFLCLLASRTDAGRNESVYTAEDSPKVDRFLGSPQWRENWKNRVNLRQNFGDFVSEMFDQRMQTLGYLPNAPGDMRTIKDSNRALYRLALFARHPTARHFWTQVLKYSIPQRRLFD